MELRQKTELRRLLIPEIRQSLKILTLPLPELEAIIQEELLTNPVIEETPPAQIPASTAGDTTPFEKPDPEFRISLLTKQPSLQEVLLIQLGINTGTDEEIRIGQKIIEYIDDNGFLRETVDTIAAGLEADAESVRKVLAIIQGFEPPGVGAGSITQCLLIQLERSNDHDPIVRKIVVSHLEGMEKPRPELFLRAVSRLGGVPKDALHVGDVPELDEAGATLAGIASVIVDRRARRTDSRNALRDLSALPAIARAGF